MLYLEFFFVSPLDAESSPMFRRCSDDCVSVRCTAVNTTVVKPVDVAADSSVEGTVQTEILNYYLAALTTYDLQGRAQVCSLCGQDRRVEHRGGRPRAGGGFLGIGL